MDNEKLKEIRNNVAFLPMLRERADTLRRKLHQAEEDVRELLQKYEKECMDVEQLKNNSFSATLLKWVGKYEGRLEKESQEIISAKLEYDRADIRVKELRAELAETEDRIYSLNSDEKIYDAEMKRREQILTEQMENTVYIQYRKLETERDILERQLVEIKEAIRSGMRAKSTALSVLQHLDSAEGWATYDVWFKGGILTHAAKYGHIDQAESDFIRLSSQLKDFKKELSDIAMPEVHGMVGIDSTTRTLDFWFDNIFTDLRVRDQIRDDSDQIRKVSGTIDRTIVKIEDRKSEIIKILDDLETRKKDLMISMEP
jgi:hypothetical protein